MTDKEKVEMYSDRIKELRDDLAAVAFLIEKRNREAKKGCGFGSTDGLCAAWLRSYKTKWYRIGLGLK